MSSDEQSNSKAAQQGHPGLAKKSFERYVRKHHQLLASHIVGVETVDHPTGGQILKFGKQYFHAVDQLLGDR